MIQLHGSWVAMPTPFTENDKIDFNGFETLIDRQIKYGTSQIFILGSAGEVTLLTLEEKKAIVHEVIKIVNGRIPVFFSAAYVLINQTATFIHMDTCMSSVSIPCGIYNNPSRLGVQVMPETIKKLSDAHPNFVVDKEALPNVEQLVQVQRLCQGKVKIMCCDFPKYSIVLPTLAVGGTGTANIGGNIIPEEAALYSRPWTDMKIIEECRENYFKWFPLLQELYTFSNPVVIKAALNILGLPGGHLRKPYQDYAGNKLKELENLMGEMGVIDKYGVKN